MDFKLEDGSTGRVTYTREGYYEAIIEGLSEYEYFDNIDYWCWNKRLKAIFLGYFENALKKLRGKWYFLHIRPNVNFNLTRLTFIRRFTIIRYVQKNSHCRAKSPVGYGREGNLWLKYVSEKTSLWKTLERDSSGWPREKAHWRSFASVSITRSRASRERKRQKLPGRGNADYFARKVEDLFGGG